MKYIIVVFIILLVGINFISSTTESHQILRFDPSITSHAESLPIDQIKLPPRFKIDVFAEVKDARSMVRSPSGIIYIGNKSEDKVYAIQDTDNDFKADKGWVIASGLNMPNGVAFKSDDLYVAEVNRIIKFPKIEDHLGDRSEPIVMNSQFPNETHHGWRYIAFGPDGKLYVPVGAPCNICESDDNYASITRINDDGSGREIYARGIRNTVGFTWHPQTNELWFTDNGRDMLGDDFPPCELNKAPRVGMHFGYPYCHGDDIMDPEFGSKHPCSVFISPAHKLGPHVAPLGLKFYTGSMFPGVYKNNIFIAEHGSWNRSKKIGYRVSLVNVENNSDAVSYSTFANGWLNEETQEAWGRPVDVLLLPDGSMLVSDDKAGVIYRISYE